MGKCACAGGTAIRRIYWLQAEGVARGRCARPASEAADPPSSCWLSEKARGEKRGPALGAGTKGAIPLARDLTSQWEARGGGFCGARRSPRDNGGGGGEELRNVRR